MSRYLNLAFVTSVLPLFLLQACSGSAEVHGDPDDCQSQTCEDDAGHVEDDSDDRDMDTVSDVESSIPDVGSMDDANDEIEVVDSVQGDFEALQALYNSTQGQGVPTLPSVDDLPSIDEATYPFMYIVSGEIHALERDQQGEFTSWTNFGEPWLDTSGWTNMTPETMGDAVGIDVDDDGRVVKIDMQKVTTRPFAEGEVELAGNNLVGVLPDEIGNLHKLQFFNVKQNFFHGPIPESIENWRESVRLSFGGQNNELDLENRIQWHEGNHRYVYLDLEAGETSNRGKKVVATNRFQTDVPFGINGFQNLELIEIRHQYLTGTLPEWDDLPSIKGIFLSESFDSDENTISGPIPESWGNLTSVIWLDLLQKNRSKRYSGDIPESLDNWEELANIKLVNNNFTGPVPEFLNARDKIYVTLGDNDFSGRFPSGYFNGDNARLSKWGFGRLDLTGELPETITKPVYPRERENYAIDAPSIDKNNFEGELPTWFVSMLGLQILNVMDNNFTGPFPIEVTQQNNLKTIFLNGNEFSGPLPDVEWGDRNINWFYIQGNNFEGEIPDKWISLFQDTEGNWHTGQKRYIFSDNNLSGRIPLWGMHAGVEHYRFDRNRYTFRDIGPVYDQLKNALGDGFSVSDQKPFGEPQTRTASEGESATIDLSEFDYPGNSYQWLKDGTAIGGANSSVLTIENVSNADEGDYVLEVENSNLAQLGAHQSEPISLQVR